MNEAHYALAKAIASRSTGKGVEVFTFTLSELEEFVAAVRKPDLKELEDVREELFDWRLQARMLGRP